MANQALIQQTIPFSYAKRHGVVIRGVEKDKVIIGFEKQPSTTIFSELQRKLGMPLKLEPLSHDAFVRVLAKTYETDSSTAMQMAEDFGGTLDLKKLIHEMPKAEDLMETQDDAPIIRLLNALLTEAIKEDASDIHIETFEDKLSIRFRIDGVLREVLAPQRVLAPLIISRVKVMAKLDIAEKRLPQDGRISLKIAGRQVDVRVSTMPTSYGERIVLRILDKDNAKLDLTDLGMPESQLKLFRELIKKPNGIILVTGPTGSGKTTTLYAGITELNNETRNILTVEDPVEYDLPGIGQTQVNSKVNMTFAKGLRAILRQDPDIVMVGEIRDLETAEIAIQASLTGHLVLSTLHTNSALGAITRLHDMGVEPFLQSSSLIGVLAQRLVRRLCKVCREKKTAIKSECDFLNINSDHAPEIYHAKGCEQCKHTGYRGRSGIYELIAINSTLKNLIHDRASEHALTEYARTLFPSIREDGIRRILNGDTTIEEVARVTSET